MTAVPNELERTILEVVEALQHGNGRYYERCNKEVASPVTLSDGVPAAIIRAELTEHPSLTDQVNGDKVSGVFEKMITRQWLEREWQDHFFWPHPLSYKRPDGKTISTNYDSKQGMHEALLDDKVVADDSDDDFHKPQGFACYWLTPSGLAILDESRNPDDSYSITNKSDDSSANDTQQQYILDDITPLGGDAIKNYDETVQPSIQITSTQVCILKTLGTMTLIGQKLADKAKRNYNGHFKAALAEMVKLQLLVNTSQKGYTATPKGRAALPVD